MRSYPTDEVMARVRGAGLISTDVFDTLLLRTTRSQRARVMRAETLFSLTLACHNIRVSADHLMEARLEAQRLAFRALHRGAEVRLTDVISRQLRLLGVPDAFAEERLRIEIEVEKRSLRPNRPLADILRAGRRAGLRVVAVSDTMLPAAAVRELIEHFHGADLIDRVYSSADCSQTKRDENLFSLVAESEQVAPARILHFGDDYGADVAAARAQGFDACHVPRAANFSRARAMNAVFTEAKRHGRKFWRTARLTHPSFDDSMAVGRDVLGPITVQFCQLIWLYAAQASAKNDATLLFCARGGVGIRDAFERVIAKFNLPLDAPRANLMISRLVAARAALLARSAAAEEELGREFRSATLADAAAAVGGGAYDLPAAWRAPFDGKAFTTLLFGPSGAAVLADIRAQNDLFMRHLDALAGDASRVILCDTGLYGSTQRLLASALPGRRFETIQFARSNYKRHGEEHFPNVAGLLLERSGYNPLDERSCVLRYWHLIESLFEPAVPSVRAFAEDAQGGVTANCGDIRFGVYNASHGNALLAGVLAYIDALPAGGGAQIAGDAERAWIRLKRAITQPSLKEVRCLEVKNRSIDFGRAGVVQSMSAPSCSDPHFKLASLKQQLWREGAIAREFPVLKYILLPLLDSLQTVRGMMRHG